MRDYSFIRAIALLTAFASFLAPSISQAADGAALPRMALSAAPEQYPGAAIVANAEGAAVIRATIGIDGQVSGARIETSSGHTLLDDASIALSNSSRLSTPPTNAAGEPVSTNVLIDVTWHLPLEPADAYFLDASTRVTGVALPSFAENADVRARDFPADAIRRNISEVVALRILVTESGETDSVEITHSSGLSSIDRAALAIGRRLEWIPASRDGFPIAAETPFVLYFQLIPGAVSRQCHSEPLIHENTVEITGELVSARGAEGSGLILRGRWVHVTEAGEIDVALLHTDDGWHKLSDEFVATVNPTSPYEPRMIDGRPASCWYFNPLPLQQDS